MPVTPAMQGKVHALLVSLHFYAVVLINYIVISPLHRQDAILSPLDILCNTKNWSFSSTCKNLEAHPLGAEIWLPKNLILVGKH